MRGLRFGKNQHPCTLVRGTRAAYGDRRTGRPSGAPRSCTLVRAGWPQIVSRKGAVSRATTWWLGGRGQRGRSARRKVAIAARKTLLHTEIYSLNSSQVTATETCHVDTNGSCRSGRWGARHCRRSAARRCLSAAGVQELTSTYSGSGSYRDRRGKGQPLLIRNVSSCGRASSRACRGRLVRQNRRQ